MTSKLPINPPSGSQKPNPLPLQRLKRNGDGQPTFFMPTEWDDIHQQSYVRMDMIEAHCRGEKLGFIDVDKILVTFLVDQNDIPYTPLRIQYCEGTMVLNVIQNPTATPIQPIQQADDLSEVLRHLEKTSILLLQAVDKQNSVMADRCREEIADYMSFIRGYPSDDAKIAAAKLDELRYRVPRYFFLRMQKRTICRTAFRMHLLCEWGIYHQDAYNEVQDDHEDDSDSDNENDGEKIHPVRPLLARISNGRNALDNNSVNKSDTPTTHLSNHRGYKISNARDFCKKYGVHVLNVLRFLHVSLVLAGIVVPGMTALGHSAWYSSVQAFLDYNNQSISEPLLSSMKYVAKAISDELELKEWYHHTDLRALLPLDGNEYIQFEAFLNDLDHSKENGNLIPTLCPRTGLFKWLCRDHAKISPKGAQRVNDLDTFVRKMGNDYNDISTYGKEPIYFDRATGELGVLLLPDTTVMFQLYNILVEAPGICKVAVTLASTAATTDFESLISTLAKSNTPTISLDGKHIRMKGSWHNSLLQVLTNKRCRSLQVSGFKDFFTNITDTSITKNKNLERTLWLKSLHLECELQIDQLSKLGEILGLCPMLQYLTLKTRYSVQLRNVVCRSLFGLRQLTVLDLDGDNNTILRFSKNDKGDILYTIEVHVMKGCIQELNPNILPYLTTLRIDNRRNIGQDFGEALASLVQKCPGLGIIDVQLALQYFETFTDLLKDNFDTTNKINGAKDKARYLYLRSLEDEHLVVMTVMIQGNSIVDTTIEVETNGNGGRHDKNDHLETFFQQYGPHIKLLVFDDSADNRLLEAYNASIANNLPELDVLTVDSFGLSTDCCLQTILSRSPNLSTLAISLSSLQCEGQLRKAENFISLYGELTTNLYLSGEGPNWLYGLEVDRSQLKRLHHFVINGYGKTKFKSKSVNKIVQLISSPDSSDIHSLRSVSLCDCKFSLKDWSTIVSSLDLKNLEHLSFEATNFGLDQMTALTRRIPIQSTLPLRALDIRKTPAAKDKNRCIVESDLLVRIRKISVIVDENTP